MPDQDPAAQDLLSRQVLKEVQTRSTFNIGQVDLLFSDYQSDFSSVESLIDEISK